MLDNSVEIAYILIPFSLVSATSCVVNELSPCLAFFFFRDSDHACLFPCGG